MSWIESHTNLKRHPKLRKLARLLEVSRREACGLVHFLWYEVFDLGKTDRRIEKGDVTNIGAEDIATFCDEPPEQGEKLVEKLLAAGFLDKKGDRLKVHHWMHFAGRIVKERERNRRRRRENDRNRDRGLDLGSDHGSDRGRDQGTVPTVPYVPTEPNQPKAVRDGSEKTAGKSNVRRPTVSQIGVALDGKEHLINNGGVAGLLDLFEARWPSMEPRFVLAAAMQSREKRNPVGHFCKMVADPNWVPADRCMERAKSQLVKLGRN